MPETPTLLARLDLRAAETPDLVQVTDDDAPRSIVILMRDSRRMAIGLIRLGVKPGDRVAIWLPNCEPWLVAFLACARIGAIAVAVNTRFRAAELSDILERSEAAVMIMWPGFNGIDFASILASVDPSTCTALTTIIAVSHEGDAIDSRIMPKADLRYIDYRDLLMSDGPKTPPPPPVSQDRACIIFLTSGTSRAPKFVQHTLRSISLHASAVCGAVGLDRPEARLQLAIPLCGVFGFVQAAAALYGGAQLRMMSRFNAEAAARSVIADRITHLIGSDAMFAELMKQSDATPIFPGLEFCGFGAFTPSLADLPTQAAKRGLRLRGVYGSSEVFALFAIQDDDADVGMSARPGGRPVAPGARVRVTGDDQVKPHGTPGEIEIYAPSLTIGYFGDAEASRAAFTADGFFRTGDLGYTLEDGRFIYLSRMGDMLRLSGYLVSPSEIEAIIAEVPRVAACQVVGISENGTEHACSFVILRETAAAADHAEIGHRIISHCRERTAQYKVPAHVFIVEAFPTAQGPNGIKVQKNVLRKTAQDLLEAG